MIKSRLIVSICAAVMLVIPMIAAHTVLAAPVPAIDVTIPDSDNVELNNLYSFGYEFEAEINFTVTALGIYDLSTEDDLKGDYDVAIWNVSNPSTWIVKDRVNAGDPLTDGYRYKTLDTPISLIDGQVYRIAAIGIGSGKKDYVTGAISTINDTTPWLSLNDTGLYATGSTLAYPDQSHDKFRQYITPNMLVTPVPGAVWLLGSGLVGLVAIRRSRKNR